jgi:PKHD-type hydroxylase
MASNFSYWYGNSVYNLDELRFMVDFIEKNHNSNFKDQPAENVDKTATVKIISWELVKQYMYKSQEITKYFNSTEIGYDLFDITDCHTVNYNVYDSLNQGEYGWHVDATSHGAPTDVKLTVIINASTEKYEGGNFNLFRHGIVDAVEFNEPGSMICFPSYIPHRVLPVTSGVRRSISYWIHGPKFR